MAAVQFRLAAPPGISSFIGEPDRLSLDSSSTSMMSSLIHRMYSTIHSTSKQKHQKHAWILSIPVGGSTYLFPGQKLKIAPTKFAAVRSITYGIRATTTDITVKWK